MFDKMGGVRTRGISGRGAEPPPPPKPLFLAGEMFLKSTYIKLNNHRIPSPMFLGSM